MPHTTLGGMPLDLPALVRQRVPEASAWQSKLAERVTGAPSPSPFWFIYPRVAAVGDYVPPIGVGPTEEAAWLDAWQRQEANITEEQRLDAEDEG